MPGWLESLSSFFTQTFGTSTLPLHELVGRLIVAGLLGAAVAVVYAWTRRDDSPTTSFFATLVLLCILLATVTQVIGDNVARAFGLVGALSIVRFRTVVEDTRDTAFVILAVIIGMAIGVGNLGLALATLATCTVAAALMQQRQTKAAGPGDSWSLSLRAGLGHELEARIRDVFSQHVEASHLLGLSTVRQGAAIEQNWTIRLRPGVAPTTLLADLNRLEGVQNVEMKKASAAVG